MKSATKSAPKYLCFAQQMRAQIHSGALAPGDRLPSFSQVRAEHGLSQNTLEKGHALLEHEGLIVRRQGSGIFVAERQRARSGIIGFFVSTIIEQRHPYWAHLLQGAQSAATKHDLQVMLLNEEATSTAWDKVDGVVSASALSEMPPKMRGISLLLSDEQNGIAADDQGGARAATEHLLALGHRRIATLMFGYDPYSKQRLIGYESALREAGIKPLAAWHGKLRSPTFRAHAEIGRDSMARWLAGAMPQSVSWRETGCTALLAQNDDVAIGVIGALREAGLSVPRDVSVVGFDGTEIGNAFSPRLTSVEVPLEAIGACGVENLLLVLQGKKISAQVLPTRLQVRDSTAPAHT